MPSKEGDPTTKQKPLTRSPEIHIGSMDRKKGQAFVFIFFSAGL
jgi:hypothetical protein